MPSPQGTYWIGTIPASSGWQVPDELPQSCTWLRGQAEIGEGGHEHYQVFVAFRRSVRLSAVRKIFPGHWELSRSRAAEEYVWKDHTRVPGSQFELGQRPFNRSSKTDWETVRTAAQSGDFVSIPPDIYVKHYSALRRISADHSKPPAMERSCSVFWGATGTGKSRRAWDEAGLDAYSKDPLSKW